jgi:pyrroline-5-carboxylate reductase
MEQFKLGFIGSGKMATAIAAGIVNNKIFAGNQIIAADISEESLKAFADKTGAVTCLDNDRVMSECETVILAVKPQIAEKVCSTLTVPKGTHIVSIAAGLKISSLSQWLSTDKISRVMPNTPLMVGKGASAYCSAPTVNADEKKLLEEVFGSAGIIHQVEENDIDAVTGVSGSGPAYVFEFIQSLADAGIKNGLSAKVALELAVQTVAGAAEMVQSNMGTPDDLRNAVTSPNGTTYAALQVLNENGFRNLISNAVDAAVKRSIELGKE